VTRKGAGPRIADKTPTQPEISFPSPVARFRGREDPQALISLSIDEFI